LTTKKTAARAFDERAAALGRTVSFLKEWQEQAIKTGSSKYHGVTKQGMKWLARITIDGERKNLGGL
jgi:ABC-type phosphonate transport system ATPase subunit